MAPAKLNLTSKLEDSILKVARLPFAMCKGLGVLGKHYSSSASLLSPSVALPQHVRNWPCTSRRPTYIRSLHVMQDDTLHPLKCMRTCQGCSQAANAILAP